jgi:hypothetical protein
MNNALFVVIYILVSVLGIPLLFFGMPFLLAGIYRFFLYMAKYDSEKARKIFWKQVICIGIAWIIFILIYFGVYR